MGLYFFGPLYRPIGL